MILFPSVVQASGPPKFGCLSLKHRLHLSAWSALFLWFLRAFLFLVYRTAVYLRLTPYFLPTVPLRGRRVVVRWRLRHSRHRILAVILRPYAVYGTACSPRSAVRSPQSAARRILSVEILPTWRSVALAAAVHTESTCWSHLSRRIQGLYVRIYFDGKCSFLPLHAKAMNICPRFFL
jgi:hypothetical protein